MKSVKDFASEPEILARALMFQVMLNAGCINAQEPDDWPRRYPEKHRKAIGAAAVAFFAEYPELLNELSIEAICDEEITELPEVPGLSKDETNLDTSTNPFWVALQDALNAYYNDGI